MNDTFKAYCRGQLFETSKQVGALFKEALERTDQLTLKASTATPEELETMILDIETKRLEAHEDLVTALRHIANLKAGEPKT